MVPVRGAGTIRQRWGGSELVRPDATWASCSSAKARRPWDRRNARLLATALRANDRRPGCGGTVAARDEPRDRAATTGVSVRTGEANRALNGSSSPCPSVEYGF